MAGPAPRMRAAVLLAVVAIVAARAAATEDDGLPLVLVPQGLSNIVQPGDAFLVREGTLTLTAFSRRPPGGGGRVVWCPREQLFYDPGHGSLWDRQGRWDYGPAPRDLDRLPVRVSSEHLVSLDTSRPQRAAGRSRGEIDEGVLSFYQRYLNRDVSPFNPDAAKLLIWCPNPAG